MVGGHDDAGADDVKNALAAIEEELKANKNKVSLIEQHCKQVEERTNLCETPRLLLVNLIKQHPQCQNQTD